MLLHCPIGCSYLISHREAVVIMLVMVPISCYTHISQQVEMFLIRWSKLSRRGPPRLLDCSSLMRPRVLGSLAGQVVTQSAYVEHSCKRFLYICLQLRLRMGPRGFLTRGLEEARPKLVRKQPGGTSCFKEPELMRWESFSSQLEDRSACNKCKTATCEEDLHLRWPSDLLMWGGVSLSVECVGVAL